MTREEQVTRLIASAETVSREGARVIGSNVGHCKIDKPMFDALCDLGETLAEIKKGST
jgi:hypothetical protein